MTTLTQIHQLLAYLYGDDTIPVATDTEYLRRTAFINASIKRLYNLREWNHLAIIESVVITGGVATLAKRPSSVLSVKSTEDTYTKVEYEDYDSFNVNPIFYETATGFVTNKTVTPLTVKYIPAFVDLLLITSNVDFPASLVAKGALVEVRRQEDPEYDATQDQQAYKEELREFSALQNRSINKVITSSYQL